MPGSANLEREPVGSRDPSDTGSVALPAVLPAGEVLVRGAVRARTARLAAPVPGVWGAAPGQAPPQPVPRLQARQRRQAAIFILSPELQLLIGPESEKRCHDEPDGDERHGGGGHAGLGPLEQIPQPGLCPAAPTRREEVGLQLGFLSVPLEYPPLLESRQ